MLTTITSIAKRYFVFEGILALIVSDFIFVSGTSLWLPYLNIYYSFIGFSAFDIGLISTIQNAISYLTMMPAGILADRIGRKKPILFSFSLTFIYTVALILVQDYLFILIITCIQGVAIGLRTPIIIAYILDVVQERRGAALATNSFFQFIGRILGTAVGAHITEAWGFQNAFLIGAVVVSIAGVYCFFKLVESMTLSITYDKSTIQSFKSGFNLMRNTSILLLMAGCIMHQVAVNFANPYISLYLKNILLLDLIIVGVLLNARQIGDVIGQIPGGFAIDRIGPEIIFFLHVSLTGFLVFFFGSSSNIYLLFLILLIWGSENSWDMPARRLLMVKYSEGTGSATAIGSIQSFIGLMSLISPTIGGWIWDNLGPATLFQSSTVANTLACVPLIMLIWKAYKNGKKRLNNS